MMVRQFRSLAEAFVILVLTLGASSCGSDSQDAEFFDPRQSTGSVGGVSLDPSMTSEESARLGQDIERMSTLPVDGARIRYFSDIFGGVSSADVARYFQERVNWVLSSKVDIDSILVPTGPPISPIGRISVHQETAPGEETKPQIVASNVGAAVWLLSAAQLLPPVGFQIGSELVAVQSTRVGVIRLGEAYDTPPGLEMIRVATLVHEARHSDCTGGVSQQDLNRVRDGQEPIGKTCGHLHVDCPAGHPYEGYAACDEHPWGAYAVESVYLASIARACDGCSEEEKKVSTALFVDAVSRVLDLEPLLEGRLGVPDMSSTDSITP